MPYERIFGLEVADQDTYTQYRKEMVPLMEAGGTFRYNFDVAGNTCGSTGDGASLHP